MENNDPLERLLAKTKESGIPMAHVCERAGIAQTTPSRWKNGKSRPTMDKLVALENALGILMMERALP